MKKFSTVKHCSLVFCTLLVFSDMISSIPIYNIDESDIGNRDKGHQTRNRSVDIRDLYDFVLKKKIVDDDMGQSHPIARKSNRSPSLRLRFGKKRDFNFQNPPFVLPSFYYEDDSDN